MKTLFILSCITFVISVFIIGCGDGQNLPLSPEEQAFMAPLAQGKGNNGNQGNGNSYGHNKILAINTSSEEVVFVPEIAVEKSPNLEPVDFVIQVIDDNRIVYVIYVYSTSEISEDEINGIIEEIEKEFGGRTEESYQYKGQTIPIPSIIIGLSRSGDESISNITDKIEELGMMTHADALPK